jgi:hypothetical protein
MGKQSPFRKYCRKYLANTAENTLTDYTGLHTVSAHRLIFEGAREFTIALSDSIYDTFAERAGYFLRFHSSERP